jgi:hypothetical protein
MQSAPDGPSKLLFCLSKRIIMKFKTRVNVDTPEKGAKHQHHEFHGKASNAGAHKPEGQKFAPISKRSQTEANRPEVLSSYSGSSGSMTSSNEKYSQKGSFKPRKEQI